MVLYCVAENELKPLKCTHLFLKITLWYKIVSHVFWIRKLNKKEGSKLYKIMLWNKYTNQNQDRESDFRLNQFTII